MWLVKLTTFLQINYKGKYYSMEGWHQTHPSPQRTPVIFQAGASKAGIAFGGKHAEGTYLFIPFYCQTPLTNSSYICGLANNHLLTPTPSAIFCAHSTIAATKVYTTSVRAAATLHGRDASTIKFFLGAMIFVAPTLAEARAKFARAQALCSTQGGLARFSDFTNTDMSVYPASRPFRFEEGAGENAIHGAIEGMKTVLASRSESSGGEEEEITPEDVGEMLALGGMGPRPIGTPEMVADELIKWAEEGDVQGFNLASVLLPGSWEDVVDLLVPELQRRGVYWEDYPVVGGSLRENMDQRPGGRLLDETHPGSSKFRMSG